MAKFDLNDSSVVCIIGSGAGGGTLGNELAQKGIKVVCLEAGPRLKLDDIKNDFLGMFGKLSWLDSREGTGQLMLVYLHGSVKWLVELPFTGLEHH